MDKKKIKKMLAGMSIVGLVFGSGAMAQAGDGSSCGSTDTPAEQVEQGSCGQGSCGGAGMEEMDVVDEMTVDQGELAMTEEEMVTTEDMDAVS